ncbi:MAG: ABC transporter substrate-binding protein [Verrucomicrobia bacterium]|nr:ABC transporter substrate-binding protein [Verrucomicrobiota bacterium]MBV9672518.1 ABC transporter substrate-binding protein [Verrucomicrobiota bacterium]
MKNLLLLFASLIALTVSTLGQTELKFWINSSLGAHEKDAYKKAADDFVQKNSGIKVSTEIVPGSETDVAKLMTAVRSGAGPDIAIIDRFTIAQRAASGLLVDLTPLIAKEDADLSKKYSAGPWQEVLYQNKVYALPTNTDARVLFYNKQLLRDAGIDPAEFDQAKGPIDPERFEQLAFKLNQTDSSGAYTRIGFVPWLEQGWGYTWGYAFGGSFFDFSNCKVTATNPGVVKGYQFLYDWAKALNPQKARTFVDTYWQWPSVGTLPDSQMPFFTGKVAFVISGNWVFATMKDVAPTLDYGVTYIPAPNGRKTTWSGGWSVAILQGSKNVEAAYHLLRFVSGEEGQTLLVKQAASLPTLQSLLQRKELFAPEYQFFLSLLPDSRSRPPIPVGAVLWDKLKEAEESVITNSQKPEPALQTVDETVQPQMNRFCK